MVPLDATVSRSAGVVGDVRRSELRVDRRTGAGARSHSGLPPRWPGGRQAHLNAKGGVNAAVKVPALAPGMAAGADSIADMDLLRHGGMDRLFTGIRAPSTLGTFLRAITFGHIRPAGVRRRGLPHRPGPENAAAARRDPFTYLDLDDTIRATHDYAKPGVGYGYTKVKDLNALLATVSTPTAAPVIAPSRLRKGSSNSARGAAVPTAEALGTARTARRGGAHFSITARMTATVKKAIGAIGADAWTAIRYPQAVWDEEASAGSPTPRSPRSRSPAAAR